MTESQITFATQDGRELLLEGVHYDVTIDGLMAKTIIRQNYSNPYDTNIEAVYTFPLTPDSVLLGIEIKINDRSLKGIIVEKSEAEAQYEEAIDEGNRAIMVEKSSDGIYTVNIANLLPKDKISVIIEYTQLLEWRQDQVKWSLPTTIATKYGNPSELKLDDVTDPAISLMAENLFSFDMKIKGVLSDSVVNAPSHQINIDKNEEYTKVSLMNENEFMDKDIVFTFKTQKSREERSFTLVGKDFDRYAAIASFYPSFGADLPKQPKSVTFVIDCSGSMSGISIDRARTALHKALNLFDEEDNFNIIKFGSHHSSLFDEEVPATQKNINIAKRMVRSLDADMGGTEMAEALQSAYTGHIISKDKKGYLFLITDGEIYDHNRVIRNAKKSEMAHFVVGVGYASDDALLKKVASETKGSYENIDPNEKMDDYILSLFKKIDTPKATDVKVEWPIRAKIDHTPSTIFDGDTVYAYGTFDEMPEGKVTLAYTLENGNQYRTSVNIAQKEISDEEAPSVISKLVIAKEIEALMAKYPVGRYYREDVESAESKEIVRYSILYQLFSELTNYILVDEIVESEKPKGLPEMHRVKSMIAESLVNCLILSDSAIPSLEEFEKAEGVSYGDKKVSFESSKGMMDDNEVNESLNISFEDIAPDPSKMIYGEELIGDMWDHIPSLEHERYLMLFNDWFEKYHRLPRKRKELDQMGLPNDITSLFGTINFRRQIKAFVIRLYFNADNDMLADDFVEYIQKMIDGRLGMKGEIFAYVGGLW